MVLELSINLLRIHKLSLLFNEEIKMDKIEPLVEINFKYLLSQYKKKKYNKKKNNKKKKNKKKNKEKK